jgi:hypothetical protein
MSATSSISEPKVGYPDAKDGAETPDAKTGAAPTAYVDLRLGESDGGVYAVGGTLASYEPIEKYEGKHRYDPQFEWTEKEEKKLVRRVCDCPITNAVRFLFM